MCKFKIDNYYMFLNQCTMFHERLQKINTLNKILSLKYRKASELEFNVPKCPVYQVTMSPLNIRVIQ